MTQEHPVTPPPELVQQWIGDYYGCPVSGELAGVETAIATRAAQWGADQELEAIQKEIITQAWFGDPRHRLAQLRAARRPKPPSLKEQSLALIDLIQGNKKAWDISDLKVVRRALEALPND